MSNASDHFNIGDMIEVIEEFSDIVQKYRNLYGEPPYKITSMSDVWVRLNGASSGTNHDRLRLYSLTDDEILDFVELVETTTRGGIYRHSNQRGYSIKIKEEYVSLSDKQNEQVNNRLNSKQHFKDNPELFKV